MPPGSPHGCHTDASDTLEHTWVMCDSGKKNKKRHFVHLHVDIAIFG